MHPLILHTVFMQIRISRPIFIELSLISLIISLFEMTNNLNLEWFKVYRLCLNNKYFSWAFYAPLTVCKEIRMPRLWQKRQFPTKILWLQELYQLIQPRQIEHHFQLSILVFWCRVLSFLGIVRRVHWSSIIF